MAHQETGVAIKKDNHHQLQEISRQELNDARYVGPEDLSDADFLVLKD
jgi:hypothetical protein